MLSRGGVFLYPHDSRDPKKPGKLRHIYEANPIALLMEQAGGAASTGRESILDVVPQTLHQRIAVIMGARDEVRLIDAYYDACPDINGVKARLESADKLA